MNLTLTSLEALIHKATQESLPCPDAAALEAFYTLMLVSPDGPQLAAQALAARIQSPNRKEAMLALSVVDRFLRRGDSIFLAEIGKFRFLNEMIKLVSPKYLANKTSLDVKTRVLQLLHAWALEYPGEVKIKVAYDMLKYQGVVKETPPPLPPEELVLPKGKRKGKPMTAIFEDEKKTKQLQKLLQSKNPGDIQNANTMIKCMVREEERRNQEWDQKNMEAAMAQDSARLLKDMLEYAETATPTADEEQIMDELNAVCARMRPQIQHMAITNIHTMCMSEVLQTIDLLYEVQRKYNYFKTAVCECDSAETTQAQVQDSNDTLLDFAGSTAFSEQDVPKNDAKKNAMEELGDIFAADTGTVSGEATLAAEPLKPVNLMSSSNDDVDLLGEKPRAEGWVELDSLGEQLLKQSLPENAPRSDSFITKAKKIPMNALASPKHDPLPSKDAIFDLDFLTQKTETNTQEQPKATSSDDVMVDISTEIIVNNNNSVNKSNNAVNKSDGCMVDLGLPGNGKAEENGEAKPNNNGERRMSKGDVKPLTDIQMSLESVTPGKVPPLTAFEEEDGLSVVLHFCKDKPRADVNVIVVSTTSKNMSPITEYKFQGVVPKGSKCRLLSASGDSLPAWNPFLPPPALTQILLVARPPSQPAIGLKFVLTYTCDEETCSDMGEVQLLPLDDI